MTAVAHLLGQWVVLFRDYPVPFVVIAAVLIVAAFLCVES